MFNHMWLFVVTVLRGLGVRLFWMSLTFFSLVITFAVIGAAFHLKSYTLLALVIMVMSTAAGIFGRRPKKPTTLLIVSAFGYIGFGFLLGLVYSPVPLHLNYTPLFFSVAVAALIMLEPKSSPKE